MAICRVFLQNHWQTELCSAVIYIVASAMRQVSRLLPPGVSWATLSNETIREKEDMGWYNLKHSRNSFSSQNLRLHCECLVIILIKNTIARRDILGLSTSPIKVELKHSQVGSNTTLHPMLNGHTTRLAPR